MRNDPVKHDTSWQTAGSLAAQMIYTAAANTGAVDPLKGHPGKSIDVFKNGLPRFSEKMVRATGDVPSAELSASLHANYMKGMDLCESPIERNLLAALITGGWARCEGHPVVHSAKDYAEAFPRCAIVLVPQMAVLRYRVDIGVVAQRYDGGITLFGIECDGKQFHQDAEKDHSRDVYLHAVGVRVMRASGKLLNVAPIEAADQIINAIDGMLR